MKNLFYLNAFAFSLMVIMFTQPLIGLLLMMPLGAIQVLTSLYLLSVNNKFHKKWKSFLNLHLFASLVTVINFFYFKNSYEYLTYGLLIFSLILSIYFVIVFYLIHKEQASSLKQSTFR